MAMEPTGDLLRYGVAACQVSLDNPLHRKEIARNTDRMLELVEQTVAGYAPFMDVRLLVFPEFGHAAPVKSRNEHRVAPAQFVKLQSRCFQFFVIGLVGYQEHRLGGPAQACRQFQVQGHDAVLGVNDEHDNIALSDSHLGLARYLVAQGGGAG